MTQYKTLIKEIKSRFGDNFSQHPRFLALRRLSLADVPGIRRNLTETERDIGTTEEEMEDSIQSTAKALKLGLFAKSDNVRWRQIGINLRKMAVYELWMEQYKQYEIAIILRVSSRTIRRDMKELAKFIQRDLW